MEVESRSLLTAAMASSATYTSDNKFELSMQSATGAGEDVCTSVEGVVRVNSVCRLRGRVCRVRVAVTVGT